MPALGGERAEGQEHGENKEGGAVIGQLKNRSWCQDEKHESCWPLQLHPAPESQFYEDTAPQSRAAKHRCKYSRGENVSQPDAVIPEACVALLVLEAQE